MIFVVCGTQKFPLDRLLREMDRLVETGVIREEVFAQRGHSGYVPRHFESVPFMEGGAFEERIGQCRVLVTHGGVGTILTGKEKEKAVVVFPRSARYGEHVDDHQWQIAQAFSRRGYAILCPGPEALEAALEQCQSQCFAPLTVGENVQTGVIREFLKAPAATRR